MDNLEPYMARIFDIARFDYLPTVDDILLTRVRTTGIVEEMFVVEDRPFDVVHTGGQRNERKKWIHTFDLVDAVLFVVGLKQYDQMLYEDESTNRMVCRRLLGPATSMQRLNLPCLGAGRKY